MKLLAARVQHLVPAEAVRHVGDFISPRAFTQVGATPIWAADNDAFSGFNPDRYKRMLDRMTEGVCDGAHPPVFVTVPDVVGDHDRTLDLWYKWLDELVFRGLTPAFVLQNGIEYHWDYWLAGHAELPWEDMDALFIGGSTEFKFSSHVREIVKVANLHGKWVHMGRVNSVKRMRYAKAIGCHSCDGSGMARFPSDILLPMLRALDEDEVNDARQLTLFS